MLRGLIGGSPCTYWSIAQKNGRETEASGIGWELFKNYLIPYNLGGFDFFLYENNKSMAIAIRNQIDKEFNRKYEENPDWELAWEQRTDKGHSATWTWHNEKTGKTEYISRILINSALVSAQNRNRYYWHNFPNVVQPTDRGILLKDILDSGETWNEKGYALTTKCSGAIPEDTLKRHRHTMIAEPVACRCRGREDKDGNGFAKYEVRADGKANTLDTNTVNGSMVAEPIRIGTVENEAAGNHDSKQYRVYSPEGKATTLCGEGGGMGAKTGLYACPINDTMIPAILRYERTEEAKRLRKDYESGKIKHGFHEFHEIHPRTDGKSNTLSTVQKDNMLIEYWDGKTYPVYEVKNGLITIKDKQYPIKLIAGFYIIRKLTVNECRRLQTVPEWYIMPCSNSQNYKLLGNSWTIEVIKHILQDVAGQEVEILSMYDGMSAGRIALEELSCKVLKYTAYEIDKYAIQTTTANFTDTIQKGDAFGIVNEFKTMLEATI